MAKITISYRRDDSMDITGRIFDRLSSRYGRDAVFRDIDSIPPGLDFREHIRASLGDSDVLMVVVGPHWMGGDRHGKSRIHSETDYVRTEVEIALNRKIPVIPLLVGGSDMPEPGDLPDSIREFAYRNAVPIDSGRDFDHHMNGLIRATDKILHSGSPAAPGAREPVTRTTPAEQPALLREAGDTTTTTRAERAASRPDLYFPVVGGVMTAQGLMHSAWFVTNVVTAAAAGSLQELLLQVWNYADMTFGLGGLVIGIGTIFARPWARVGGIILCLLAIFSNFLWFVEFFDKSMPRLMLVGTGFALLLFIVGIYMYLFRWPASADK
jgi:hypothetical protein